MESGDYWWVSSIGRWQNALLRTYYTGHFSIPSAHTFVSYVNFPDTNHQQAAAEAVVAPAWTTAGKPSSAGLSISWLAVKELKVTYYSY